MSVEKCGEFFVGYAARVPVIHSDEAKNMLAKCMKRKGTLAAYPTKNRLISPSQLAHLAACRHSKIQRVW
jgi:hypothetical protein